MSIYVSPANISLAAGATQQLLATGIYSDGSKRDISASAHLVSIGITPASPTIALGTTLNLKSTGVYSDDSVHDLTDAVTLVSLAVTPAVPSIALGLNLLGFLQQHRCEHQQCGRLPGFGDAADHGDDQYQCSPGQRNGIRVSDGDDANYNPSALAETY